MTRWLAAGHAATLPREVRVDVGGRRTFVCRVAQSASEQRRGLQGVANLPNNYGLYFPFSPPRLASFHMGQVKFPIDIVFMDGEGRVARVVEAATPGSRDRWSWPLTCGVIEVNAGLCKQAGVEVGDVVRVGLSKKAAARPLPDDWDIKEYDDLTKDDSRMFVMHDDFGYEVGQLSISKAKRPTRSGQEQWSVNWVEVNPTLAEGMGPTLYDRAMAWVTERDGWLKPDSKMVSDDAAPVWEFYDEQRPDVEQELQTQRPQSRTYDPSTGIPGELREERALEKRYRFGGAKTYDLARGITTAGPDKHAGPGGPGYYHQQQEPSVDHDDIGTDPEERFKERGLGYSPDALTGEMSGSLLRPMDNGPQQTSGGGSMNVEDPNIEKLHKYPIRSARVAQRIYDVDQFATALHRGMVAAGAKWEDDIVNGRLTESLLITPAIVADWMKRSGADEVSAQEAKQVASTSEGLQLLADIATRWPELFGGRVDQTKISGTNMKLFRGKIR